MRAGEKGIKNKDQETQVDPYFRPVLLSGPWLIRTRPILRTVSFTKPAPTSCNMPTTRWIGFPGAQEALRLAKDQDKPLLLSIGYSACHWCHVMERESFENDEIASLMNRYYVCVKVDREERPDLDEIYMQATIAMNQGKRRLAHDVFLTPDQQPIFAGTYFRRPTNGAGQALARSSKNCRRLGTRPPAIADSATRFTERLQTAMRSPPPQRSGSRSLTPRSSNFQRTSIRSMAGSAGPQIPPATGLAFLLRQYHRTGTDHVLHIVCKTLDAMAAGGMYDTSGRFRPVFDDERWLVPHFEKMLYDNALLAKTYLEAFQVTGNPDYKRVTREILDYILREMTSPEGGFYSATDADSEGVEGKFFVWDPEQIRDSVPSEQDAVHFWRVLRHYLRRQLGTPQYSQYPPPSRTGGGETSCSRKSFERRSTGVKPLVYQARLKRVPPGLDDKIITAWNA